MAYPIDIFGSKFKPTKGNNDCALGYLTRKGLIDLNTGNLVDVNLTKIHKSMYWQYIFYLWSQNKTHKVFDGVSSNFSPTTTKTMLRNFISDKFPTESTKLIDEKTDTLKELHREHLNTFVNNITTKYNLKNKLIERLNKGIKQNIHMIDSKEERMKLHNELIKHVSSNELDSIMEKQNQILNSKINELNKNISNPKLSLSPESKLVIKSDDNNSSNVKLKIKTKINLKQN